jgi:hypothetical protein
VGELAFKCYRPLPPSGNGDIGNMCIADETVIGRGVGMTVVPVEPSTEPGHRQRFDLAAPHLGPADLAAHRLNRLQLAESSPSRHMVRGPTICRESSKNPPSRSLQPVCESGPNRLDLAAHPRSRFDTSDG